MWKQDLTESNLFPYYFALAVLLVLVSLTYTNRVDDLDLWWHLKSGEQILKERSLPGHDTFAYTTDATIHLSEQDMQGLSNYAKPSGFQYWEVNRTQSWLGQVLFYLSYLAGGFYGIGLLKALVFVVTFLITFWTMRRKGAGPMAALLIVSLIAAIGQDFAFSRPQIFSFLGLSVLLYLFAEFKNGRRKFMTLPLLFLVWSNIHGGFVVGAILLLAFWTSETGKYLLHARYKILDRFASPAAAIRHLSFISLLSLIAMLLNPNHYKVFLLPSAIRSSIFNTIEEYARPMPYEYHAYWFMLALAILLVLLLFRRTDPTDFLFLALLAAASQMGIRAIIFFAIGVAPMIAASLSQLWQWQLRLGPAERLFSLPGMQRLAFWRPQLVVFLVLMLLFGGRQAHGEGFLKFAINADRYPENAVAFLQAENFPERLFNPYNWGGVPDLAIPSAAGFHRWPLPGRAGFFSLSAHHRCPGRPSLCGREQKSPSLEKTA